jgi:putative membrane protein
MKKYISVLLVIAVIILLSSCGKKADTQDSKEEATGQNEDKFKDSDMKKDSEFVVAAADGGQYEVELGKLAVANGGSEQVKKLGQMMVDDHTKANSELKTLAQQKNITLPEALSDKCQKKYEELAKKSGYEFDKEYSELMVRDHKEDLAAFKKESEKGADPEVMAWAAGKVPVLEHHLRTAEDTHRTVKETKR